MYTAPDHIQHILRHLPTSTGVYQMLNKKGRVIYVGKAKSLRNRVRSYFQPSNRDPKVIQMREQIEDIKIIILENELMALNTEAQLINAHRPRFNVIWKDDKRYPYIVIRLKDDFPKVELTRRINRRDGNRYFGPYASVWALRNSLEALRRAFPFLTCDRDITGQDERACLYYDIHLCGGPCIGKQTKNEYRASIEGLMDVLEGGGSDIIDDLKIKMEAAADNLDFERAAILRDRVKALESVMTRQYLVTSPDTNCDVLGLGKDTYHALIQLFIIRKGRMIASESFPLENIEFEQAADIIGSFITQYYNEAGIVPPEIILPEMPTDSKVLTAWLQEKREGKSVKLTVPQRGEKRKLITRATETAKEQLNLLEAQWANDTVRQENALKDLQDVLKLPGPPNRIECYDISTLQGTSTIASRVVFVQGAPRKSEYRKFNIKTVAHEGPDDFASMREALTRRFKRYVDGLTEDAVLAPGKKDNDETWRILPDLLLIDGGKGQLNIAVEVLDEFHLRDQVPVASLAKRIEEIFVPGQPESIILPRSHSALQLLQRARDEAHRFAVTANRSQRQKKGLVSQLETIPGVGPARRKALLKAFNNDINAIREATVEQLTQISGITQEIAQAIKAHL
ncbi:MAG: excinuclease ABC subunit UvrC [Anaerolineae bacterium]|nr:MAG: excinuclease ABC subunit UvrC [Anaerolineae bacterium]